MRDSTAMGIRERPLLSIVVPTLNRRPLLERTLTALVREMTGLEDAVELIVVNNASTDDTAAFLDAWRQSGHGEAHNFAERVVADDSFHRCVSLASGRYINIFGDDDLPMPGFLRTLLALLRAHEPTGFVYMNRLIGDEALLDIAEMAHRFNDTEVELLDIQQLASRYTHSLGCITSLAFHRDCWTRGAPMDLERFSGYRFLARLCMGAKGASCVYSGLPLFIQRRGRQSWKAHWPRYWLVSMPGLLKALQDAGVAGAAFDNWRSQDVSLGSVVGDCLVAKAYGYPLGDPFWRDARCFQPPPRAWAIRAMQYLLPAAVARVVYFSLSRNERHAADQ